MIDAGPPAYRGAKGRAPLPGAALCEMRTAGDDMSEQHRSSTRTGTFAGPRRVGLLLFGMLSLSPCEARDLEKAPARETAQPCPGYGAGFVRTPVGSTCVRVSGRVRAGADLAIGRDVTTAPTAAGRFAIDARTESDLGPVRTYVRIGNGRR